METLVFKKKADARWKPLGFGNYRCSDCWAIVAGNYHLYCPCCKAQMHKEGDLIYNEKTGEACIVKLANQLSDQELEAEYYNAVLDTLGSEAEEMYDRGYDPVDIREQEKYEKYKAEKADLLESICIKRGIKLWT